MRMISIIIPVYNKISYLEDTVRSVTGQSFSDFELLLIDDGSTDGSGDLCDKLASSDARIKVFHTKNRGVSAARNLGIEKSSGKYICFIDADDSIDRSFLEKLCDSAKGSDLNLPVCGYAGICDGKRTLHDLKDQTCENELYRIVRQDILCILWNKLFVREKIKHLFDESISSCEDSLFCLYYYLDNDPRIIYINDILYEYRVCEGGLTCSFREDTYSGILKLFKINFKLTGKISDKKIRNAAGFHICKVFFYGVYTYIFENLSKERMCERSLSAIEHVYNDGIFRKVSAYILRNTCRMRHVDRTGLFEYLLIIFSLLKMKRAVFHISRLKRCLKR